MRHTSGRSHYELLRFNEPLSADFLAITRDLAGRDHNAQAELHRADERLESFVGVVALMSDAHVYPPAYRTPIGYGWGGTVKPSVVERARGARPQVILGRLHVNPAWKECNIEARMAEHIVRLQPEHSRQVLLRMGQNDREGMTIVAQGQLGMMRTVETPVILGQGLLETDRTHPYIARSVGDLINHIQLLPGLPDVYELDNLS